MVHIIDKRQYGKHKSTINRQRFIRRFKQQIKDVVSESINKRSITDIYQGEKVAIPKRDLHEPSFGYKAGGERTIVLPGNKHYAKGDAIARPEGSEGGEAGNSASDQGEGVDDFIFELNRDEFLEIFFEDLALPNLVKTKLAEIPSFDTVRAGYSRTGNPSSISIIQSFRQAITRRRSFRAAYKKKLLALQSELDDLQKATPQDEPKIAELKTKIALTKKRSLSIPFLDSVDIRFHQRMKQPRLTSQAVMFCVMDVSGSMDETKKEIAKRFFILLYLFLTRTYKKIHIVFIRHHTIAKMVDEEEFFYSRETGGTVVSSALELTAQIIKETYPTNDWNIYVAQASDGDNWNADSPKCQAILEQQIMPLVQYYAYVEIMPRHHQSLWRAYTEVKEQYHNFAMRSINENKDIYPVFRDLFKRKNA